ncbi:MAG TPA: hypothetical protein VES60_03725 [Nakamurella sp.]|nr:hypothetical protein [Nakamurella sp.]
MTEPGPPPRWRAMEIGPGGLPADQVRPIGRGSGPDQRAVRQPSNEGKETVVEPRGTPTPPAAGWPDPRVEHAVRMPPHPPPSIGERHPAQPAFGWPGAGQPSADAGGRAGQRPAAMPSLQPAPGRPHDEQHRPPPRAALGSFDDVLPRPSRRAGLVVLVVVVAIAVVTGLALWSNTARPLGGSGELAAGDCLSSSGGPSVIPVDCGSADVEFQVVARYEDTTNSSRCAAVSSDVVLVARDSAVLCLNYVADVGDCLYAGSSGGQVGKAACRTASGGTASGLYRVLAVLPDTINDTDCPQGTVHTLVHPTSAEVLCLGRP